MSFGLSALFGLGGAASNVPSVVTATIAASQNAPVSWKGKTVDVTVTTGASTITFASADGWVDKDWCILRIVSNSGSYVLTYAGSGTLTATNDESKTKQSKGTVYAEVVGTNVRLTGKLST